MVFMTRIVGWDIGGVHTKAVWLPDGRLEQIRSVSKPFEIWRSPTELPAVLRAVYESLAIDLPEAMAVTMTAELSDAFESARQGVLFVLNALRQAFPQIPIHLLSLDREIETLDSALRHPADFAAANWLASALYTAQEQPDCLLVDVGSTTTDVTPIREGRVVAQGRSDTARLAAGELVYTGAIRTNPNTIVSWVPLQGKPCRVAAEHFAVMGDVYLLLGILQARDYTAPTPDGRSRTAQDARRRLARLVCADAETLGSDQILHLARYLHEKQVQQVSEALYQVLSRQPVPRSPLCAIGSGRFLAVEAARRLDLPLVELGIPGVVAAVLPCLAVAHLLEQHLDSGGSR
jgi:probable H4MPT-linked C1 transfer pathway protein